MVNIQKEISASLCFLACACIGLCSAPAGAVNLLQSYQAALDEDATYHISRAAADAGRETLAQARSQLLPNISASGSRSKNHLVSETPDFFGHLQSSST